MNKEKALILWFEELGIEDVPFVGGKNAALGEMYQELVPLGINIPNGFAVTAYAYRYFLQKAGLEENIKEALEGLDTHDIKDLQRRGKIVRQIILKANLPKELEEEIIQAYKKLGKNASVAVRSSATAEDLPGASFAGQQETFLNVVGEKELLLSTKKAMASLFTNRAISYREDKGFSHLDVSLSVGIQEMVRSDKASSGVLFTIDTETGFDKVVIINGSYGLGEMIVQGKVTPDEFIVFKPVLEEGSNGIIEKRRGAKKQKMIYAASGIKKVPVPVRERENFCLHDTEVVQLAQWGVAIEKHFSQKHKRKQPMDVEWAKDGVSGKLFIVQARPETVHAAAETNVYKEYRLRKKKSPMTKGTAVGTKIAVGTARVIHNVKDIGKFKKGEVLITQITDPDWEPIMKIAAAIVTDKGGRTSHAAIVSRELGIPAIVGTGNATHTIKTGDVITVDCSSGDSGLIYEGKLEFDIKEHRLDRIPETKTKVMINIGAPDEAFKNAYLPVKGVGLGRLEFIINSYIKVHPNALIDYVQLKKQRDSISRKIVKEIDSFTIGYVDKKQFYVDALAEGIAKIGAAFWPYEVIIRFSDFKTNEYRQLVGGELYEPEEQNPMLGWRGASRYYDDRFREAFGLECRAIKKARTEMGLENVTPMVPFCRTPEEGKKVLALMKQHGLSKDENPKLRVYVMCEVPSNVMRADDFLDIFDGMSIGSNDLTQLALGLDRDSGMGATIGNENDPTVRQMIAIVIRKCQERSKYVGICGQAPSDYPEFTEFLIEKGIESISLNPDTILQTLIDVKKVEERIQKNV